MMGAYGRWADIDADHREYGFRTYIGRIADARYVIRRVFRIIDERAKVYGLESLEHQMLLQLCRERGVPERISELAERLDIATALASRVARQLEDRGLLRRSQDTRDRRVIHATITRHGEDLLKEIDAAVHIHVSYFQRQLTQETRISALMIYAFYAGVEPESLLAQDLRNEMRSIVGNDFGKSR